MNGKFDIKIGQKIGDWVVVEHFKDDFTSEFFCLVCKCNKKKIVSKYQIIRKKGLSVCRICCNQEQKHFKDMTGKQCGKWTVIKKCEIQKRGSGTRWFCKCVCGYITRVAGGALRNGKSTGCRPCKALERWQKIKSK